MGIDNVISEFFHNIYNYLDEMDFVSQKKVDRYYKIIILIVAIISFVVSFVLEKFSICVYSVLIAAGVCALVFAPGWPCWKRNPVQWRTKRD